MKIRTVYLKTRDIGRACNFWSRYLDQKPHKNSKSWVEFKLDNTNLGILDLDENVTEISNCVPVFEYSDDELDVQINKALNAGAVIIFDERSNPDILSVGMRDPDGNEFEVSVFHD